MNLAMWLLAAGIAGILDARIGFLLLAIYGALLLGGAT
jgi:hypothetical protein